MFQGKAEIRDAYRDTSVATHYVDERFRSPLGSLLHDRQLAFVRQAIASHRPQRILEIAPGPARLTVGVEPVVPGTLTVVDASAQMLTEARRRLPTGRVGFVHGDAFRLPFARTFDLVYSFRLLRHFDDADRIAMCTEISRVMAPGSRLIFDAINRVVSEPLRAAAPEEYIHFDALMTPESIRREMESCGFAVEALAGVHYRFPLLKSLQVLGAPRMPRLTRHVMDVVNRSGGEPLEWIVLCRRV